MYPPAPGVDRETTEDIEYNGYKVPKGTVIGVSYFLVYTQDWTAVAPPYI